MSEEKENWDNTGMYFGIYIGVVIRDDIRHVR